MGGVPVIMENTSIDAKNPCILQHAQKTARPYCSCDKCVHRVDWEPKGKGEGGALAVHATLQDVETPTGKFYDQPSCPPTGNWFVPVWSVACITIAVVVRILFLSLTLQVLNTMVLLFSSSDMFD